MNELLCLFLFSAGQEAISIAATRLIPIHGTPKGKSISAIIGERTAYVKNPEKTEEGELISSYKCVPETIVAEFLVSKKKYENVKQERGKNIAAYHIRQSFKPGEITPELANKIGYELAMKFTHGKHAFIVCTHTDKSAPKINLLIDVQRNIQEGKGAGYEHWAELHNLKESARTLLYLQDNKLTEYQKLEEKRKKRRKRLKFSTT